MSLINKEIRNYKFISFIDSGGFGSVYLASKNNVNYAIKLFREDYVLKEYREKGENNRIHREIQIMKSVNHDHLVNYVDDFQEEIDGVRNMFLVMEFVEGETLRKIIEREGSLSEDNAIAICQKLLVGLKALHEIRGTDDNKGIIHRDLKPENVIISNSGHLKILDFGISKVIDYTTITASGQTMGSPIYMSPEQIRDSKNIGKRSDFYTVGVMLYEMLTGKVPYDFSSLPDLYNKITNEAPIPPRRFQPQISNNLENQILKLLSKEPFQRHLNIDDLSDSLTSTTGISSKKEPDLSPRFLLRLWNEKTILTQFVQNYNGIIHVEFPANFQGSQKNLLKLVSDDQFRLMIDPATLRLAYAAQNSVKGLQALPYAPDQFNVISPSFLNTVSKQQDYVKQVLDEQIKLEADILVSPYHYMHNTNVPATATRNPTQEWFDLDIKLLKESIDYIKEHFPEKPLYAGICLNANSLTDQRHKMDLLNLFSSFDCDGYFIYVDCIDNSSSSAIIYHYIKTLRELQQNTKRPVIAGRLNTLGLGLLAAGISGFSSGTARFESFYEDLYKEETEGAFNMYERYYVKELMGTIPISKKNPVKLQNIFKELGTCYCQYCVGKTHIEIIKAPNNKIHFLERIHEEVAYLRFIPENDRISYFINRVKAAKDNYAKLPDTFKKEDYAHLDRWEEVFVQLNKE
ncbi:MAG: serine/threonine-protein kinase [Saprospiraceae bacterium]|nr:serine/threonine-protein kinase [Saprospiraceae bacterium]